MKEESFKEKIQHLVFHNYAGYSVYIVVTNDVMLSRSKRSNILGPTSRDGTAYAMHSYAGRDSFLFLPPKCPPGVAAHECWHCVHRIMQYLGATIEDEVIAYNLEYLVDKTLDCLKSYK